MSVLTPVTASFVVKNRTTKVIKLFQRLPLKPGATVDLFKTADAISEAEIIDELRAPSGQLFKEIYVTKSIAVVSYDLISINNTEVGFKNLQTINKPKRGQVLSVNSGNKLKWIFGDMSARLEYEPPIIQEGERITLPKADAFTNGYLAKEDWIIFKGKSKGLRVWQYQDFSGPYTNPLKLSSFDNGRDLSFNSNLIVDGTAVVVDIKEGNSAPKKAPGIGGIFSEKLYVNQHVRDTVFLTEAPDDKQRIRVYFLIVLPDGVTVPVDYSPPTDYVRQTRIEYFDAIDVDSGGAKSIFGEKVFNDKIGIRARLALGEDIGDGKLSVSGDAAFDAVKIRHGAADGHVLTSNAIGVAEWSPSPMVSSNPPNAFDGRMWVKTPEYVPFVYDGIRKKWISTSETFNVDGSKNATSCANSYMVSSDNISNHVNALVLPYDSVLVGIIASCEASQSWVAEVHVKNKLIKDSILHVVNTDRAHNMNLNIDFKEGDKIQLYASGSGISMPYIRAIFKRRA